MFIVVFSIFSAKFYHHYVATYMQEGNHFPATLPFAVVTVFKVTIPTLGILCSKAMSGFKIFIRAIITFHLFYCLIPYM